MKRRNIIIFKTYGRETYEASNNVNLIAIQDNPIKLVFIYYKALTLCQLFRRVKPIHHARKKDYTFLIRL